MVVNEAIGVNLSKITYCYLCLEKIKNYDSHVASVGHKKMCDKKSSLYIDMAELLNAEVRIENKKERIAEKMKTEMAVFRGETTRVLKRMISLKKVTDSLLKGFLE